MKFTAESCFTIVIHSDDGKHLATLECADKCTLREANDIAKALQQVMTDETPALDLSGAVSLNDALNEYAQQQEDATNYNADIAQSVERHGR